MGVWVYGGHGGHVCGRIKADRSLGPPLLSSMFPHRGLPLCSTDSAPACPCCLGDAGVQARIDLLYAFVCVCMCVTITRNKIILVSGKGKKVYHSQMIEDLH